MRFEATSALIEQAPLELSEAAVALGEQDAARHLSAGSPSPTAGELHLVAKGRAVDDRLVVEQRREQREMHGRRLDLQATVEAYQRGEDVPLRDGVGTRERSWWQTKLSRQSWVIAALGATESVVLADAVRTILDLPPGDHKPYLVAGSVTALAVVLGHRSGGHLAEAGCARVPRAREQHTRIAWGFGAGVAATAATAIMARLFSSSIAQQLTGTSPHATGLIFFIGLQIIFSFGAIALGFSHHRRLIDARVASMKAGLHQLHLDIAGLEAALDGSEEEYRAQHAQLNQAREAALGRYRWALQARHPNPDAAAAWEDRTAREAEAGALRRIALGEADAPGAGSPPVLPRAAVLDPEPVGAPNTDPVDLNSAGPVCADAAPASGDVHEDLIRDICSPPANHRR